MRLAMSRLAGTLFLRQMECSLSLLNGDGESLPENIQTAIIGKLEVVHTSHDARKVIIRSIRRFTGPTDHSEDGSKTLEACKTKSENKQ